MDFSLTLSSAERAKVQMQVENINTALGNRFKETQSLGKDDFLKILLTQLKHQDPTKPMEDKEFIAQMAQFSTLEQITNMSGEFRELKGLLAAGQAISLLGKTVTVTEGDKSITGIVEEVAGRDVPRLLITGKYFDYSKVVNVKD